MAITLRRGKGNFSAAGAADIHYKRKLDAPFLVSLLVSASNLMDRKDNDSLITTTHSFRGESAPVADIHFHPLESRTVRAAVTMRF